MAYINTLAVISSSRPPIGQSQNGALGQDKEVISVLLRLFIFLRLSAHQDLVGSVSMMGSQRITRPEAYAESQSQTQTQPPQARQQQTGAFGSENQDSPGTTESAEQPPLSQMSERDRFGLAGLFRMIHSESPDVASLAIGQDLMSLGLDLNHPEYGLLPSNFP